MIGNDDTKPHLLRFGPASECPQLKFMAAPNFYVSGALIADDDITGTSIILIRAPAIGNRLIGMVANWQARLDSVRRGQRCHIDFSDAWESRKAAAAFGRSGRPAADFYAGRRDSRGTHGS
jgi:hypothetical protein